MFILVHIDPWNTNASNPMYIIIKYDLAHDMPTPQPILISNRTWHISNVFCDRAKSVPINVL